jgi:hypothetical protein
MDLSDRRHAIAKCSADLGEYRRHLAISVRRQARMKNLGRTDVAGNRWIAALNRAIARCEDELIALEKLTTP